MTAPIEGNAYTRLFVDDVPARARDVEKLLGISPVENQETFALFVLGGGKLGLWKIDDVKPPVTERPGASEFALAIEGGRASVDQLCASARETGISVIQEPTSMDFGYTFTAGLADGNRIRIFSPGRNAM